MRIPKPYVPIFRDLTEEETRTVQEYAARMGRYWKRELSLAWWSAREPGILQALRNELGPDWLKTYKLPKRLGSNRGQRMERYHSDNGAPCKLTCGASTCGGTIYTYTLHEDTDRIDVFCYTCKRRTEFYPRVDFDVLLPLTAAMVSRSHKENS